MIFPDFNDLLCIFELTYKNVTLVMKIPEQTLFGHFSKNDIE